MSNKSDARDSRKNLLVDLSLELALLRLQTPEHLGDRIVELLATHFQTNRVSLFFLDYKSKDPVEVITIGHDLDCDDTKRSFKVLAKVCQTKDSLFVYDIRENQEMMSPWSENYQTDAFLVIPLISDHVVQAVVCISNLNQQQLTNCANSIDEMQLITAQLTQLTNYIQLNCIATDRDSALEIATSEIELLNNLIQKLEHSFDVRSVFAVFMEVIAAHFPLEVLAVVHKDAQDKPQCTVCVGRPTHRDEIENILDRMNHRWKKRHRRSQSVSIERSSVFGKELIKEKGDCPPELRLSAIEQLPVFLDNDMFATVELAASEELLADSRKSQFLKLLINYLLLFVKKSILLMQNQEMQTLDSLTGLYNERHFYQLMEREFERANRYNMPLCLLIVDVDHFKDVNETYGFETGDLLLKEISRILVENLRQTDYISRYGGERFIVVLPETHYKNSEITANRLRRYIESNSFFIPNTNVFIKVTVSIGVASYADHQPASLAQFIEFADTALYFAKRAGRNLVVGYSHVINLMMSESENES